ncbi:MAG: methyl-accepting chemotaxis protein [Candidatus Scalindua rubra]|uniref:HAMP domain protein n=1 Tax=Candidatus Scalindua brodae TaxID=237368 RepID=A0A0B0EHM9_9BACT|nr:MAG: HAMP domain protein [Candidatus Scalindua brodae]MBZ0107993.1 methyl-accepting chemotaxis protein [Candidatus Scalindua rubra]TWU36447.1 HAMP domain protein [Candidatus Brocadiaceae bacterium S225]
MGKRKYKRRQYIIDRRFQYSLISKFAILAASIVTGSLFFLVLIYYIYGDIQVSVEQPIPFDLSDSFVDNEEMVTYSLMNLLWPVLSICLVGTIVFTFFFSLIVSHRMAGPVYRMRNLLEEMAKGDLSRPVSCLRKKDEFKHLYADINNVKEHWRLQIQELQLACRQFGEDGYHEQHLNRIKKIASSFKTEIE